MTDAFTRIYNQVDAKVLELLAELPGYWLTAADLAPCVGETRQVVSRSCIRLSGERGAIASRAVTWVSRKSRKRDRLEFCHSPGATYRTRLPEWLEPTVHPVNPLHCRHIVGRASLQFVEIPMNQSDINDLPRGVRERFYELKDEQFFNNPRVIDARAQLAKLETEQKRCVAVVHDLRTKMNELLDRADACRLQIAHLSNQRPAKLLDALLAGKDLDEDRQVLAEIAKLEHFCASVALVYPANELERMASEAGRRIRRAEQDVHTVVGEQEGLRDHLRGVLDQLKLAEAERRALA
jgi:hypothetical protein